MTTSRSDILVGVVALAVVFWILWTIQRGVREGRLPIGRGEVFRNRRAVPFAVLLGFYVIAAMGMTFVGLDLIFGIGGRL